MESKELFELSPNGYDCEQVEQYIKLLKTQYKKLFDYAKATEANNEKLKKICRSLSNENKALKTANIPAEPTETGVDRIITLSREIAKEAESLK